MKYASSLNNIKTTGFLNNEILKLLCHTSVTKILKRTFPHKYFYIKKAPKFK